MGGMIAQCAAIRYPSRVLSLTSIYSTTGNRSLPPPDPEVMDLLLTPAPRDREGYVEYMVLFIRMTTGKGFVFDEAYARQISQRAYDRSFYPEGTARQLRAIATQTDRRQALANLTVPTLIVQGTDDPLVSVEAGRDMADAIPGARLMLIEGMGHDLARGGAWPAIVEAVTTHTYMCGDVRTIKHVRTIIDISLVLHIQSQLDTEFLHFLTDDQICNDQIIR